MINAGGLAMAIAYQRLDMGLAAKYGVGSAIILDAGCQLTQS